MSAADLERDFVLRPKQSEKFRKREGEALLKEVAEEALASQTFSMSYETSITDTIAITIRDRLKALQLPHYKYIIQVSIGEQRGQGMKWALSTPLIPSLHNAFGTPIVTDMPNTSTEITHYGAR